MDLLQVLVMWWCTPGADLLLVQNFDFPPGKDFVDDSISPDPGMGSQSSIGFEVEARSSKLCLIILLFWPALSSTLSSSGKFSMAVVSTVVVDPENELIDSVATRC